MELVRINTTLNKSVLEQIDYYAEEMQEDRSTAIRQLLSRAILELHKDKIIRAYKEKKITIRAAAEFLGVDYWQMQEFLEEKGVPITDLTREEVERAKRTSKKLLGK